MKNAKNSPSYIELKAQAEKLLQQAEEIRLSERAGVIAELKATIAEYGVSARELGLSGDVRGRKTAGRTVAAKYRGPNGETWTGRGRQPAWFAAAIKAGKSKDDLLI